MHPFAKDLLDWFRRHGRTLPWRGLDDPYPVWISEIMLQQTRVETVLPYYRRFLERFPTIRHLADAEEDEVLALWSGLGYYTRARNLHAAARRIRDEHGGVFPEELSAVVNLPGIGPSTAGAILSCALDHPLPILEANVKRVLARVLLETDFPGRSPVERRLWEHARERTPSREAGDYNQAIQDLGATVCTLRKPKCGVCPVQVHCRAYAEGMVEELPARAPRKEKPVREAWFALVESDRGLLLERRPPTGFWGGLWCPPLLEKDGYTAAEACAMLEERLGSQLRRLDELPVFRHTFTHFHLELHPLRLQWVDGATLADSERTWARQEDRDRLGLPSAVAPWLKSTS
ncbi:A/G-specific adenine glycosylase [Thiohalorhabdus methylotrophus]|uniref:Adenine DNA glycosylase n=1 Tax=Thiohalorhabdus methylotrophus TaxID=3242694 RepID=A0ABV4U087_9GAMM